MNIKHSFLQSPSLILFCLSMASTGYAQLLPDPKIVSPNSASIDRFKEIPVDLFTGSPEIQIPIHTLEYGSIKVPIALRYHPSSVTPTQQPGWVGLGWDLESFGAITRRLRGYNDDLWGDPGNIETQPTNVLNSYYPVPGNTYAQSGSDLANLSNWASPGQLLTDWSGSTSHPGINDMQADEFSFNFMGYSGTFYYEGTTLGWQVVSKDNIKVALTGGTNGFAKAGDIITAISQYQEFSQPACTQCQILNASYQPNQFNGFTLTVPDGTQYVFGGTNAMEFDNDYRYNIGGATETFTFWANTWLLTKIIDPDNHEVDFTYQRTWPTCNLSFGASYFQFSANSNGCSQGMLNSGNIVTSNHGGLYQWPMYLSSISSPNETITFNIGDATCLRYPDISMQSESSDGLLQLGPQVTPNDHVFLTLINANTNNLRWEQLNNIVIKNSAGNISRQYAFGYSSSTSQRLTLNALTEEDNTGSAVQQYIFGYNNVSGLPSAMDGDQTDAWGYYNGNSVNGSGLSGVYTLKQPNASLTTTGLLTNISWPTGGNTQFSWEAHDYSQTVNTARNGVTTPTSTPSTAGGSRLKEITSYDANNHVLYDKKYFYRRGYTAGSTPGSLVSSGILNGTPVFYFQVNNRTSYSGFTNVSFTIGSLNSIGAYGYNGNGSYIGYDEVAEVNADGSYTRHFFTSYPPDVNGVSHYDNLPDGSLGWAQGEDTYMPMSTLDLERGKPIQDLDYANNNVLVRKTLYTYRSDAARFNSSVHLIDLGQLLNCNAGDEVVFTTAREQYSYEYYPMAKSVTTYDQFGNNPVNSTETYTYNVNNLLNSKTITNSNQKQVLTTYLYPTDFTDATSTAMANAHILSPIVQTTVTVNGAQQSLQHLIYYTTPSGLYAIQNVQEQIAANPIETRQVFYQYDTKGNPQEFSKANDIHTVYLWSYNGQYPVARITGSTLSQVTAIVSQATLDAACVPGNDANVRTLLQNLRSQLPGALVSSFTYLPGAGMTSETDPRGRITFYQYDTYQRLLSITDNDGNIVKTFNYNYEHQ